MTGNPLPLRIALGAIPADAGIDPVGSVGDSYDKAPAQTVIDVVRRGDSSRRALAEHRSRRVRHVEWVHRFSSKDLSNDGNVPHAELEATC